MLKRASQPQTVLVIDDDAIVRLMAREALSDAGYVVHEAADAESGCERFDALGADLILLDVILPGMNGFEACSRLRAQARGANIPILVMTGLDDRASIVSAYDSGATDFLTKPIVWDLLPYRVRYALRASDAFQETLRSRTLLDRSQQLANMGSWEWRRADDSLAWSDEMRRIVGAPEGASGQPARVSLLTHVHPDDRRQVESALAGAMDHGTAFSIEFRIVRADGSVRRLLEQTSIERLADDSIVAVHGIRRDITEQTEANERIRTLAFFDPLTGLANRSHFRNGLQLRLSQQAGAQARLAVLIVDIDRFKLINESFGPQVGDEVLKAAALRLRDCLRCAECKTLVREPIAEACIARLGSDEFTVLLADIDDGHAVRGVAELIVRALGEPLEVAGRQITIGVSIGIVVAPEHAIDTDALLRNAGTALHVAKRDALHRVQFYDDAMSAEVNRRVAIEAQLRSALARGELCVHYQAKVDTRTSRVVGAEALIRWMHPEKGLIGPAAFIPIAEESGLIAPITQWVIEEVCRQSAAWRAQGLRTVAVSVNLDAASLLNQDVVGWVAGSLERHGLEASALEIEVTESNVMRNIEQAGQVLHALRGLGLKLSIDDFGTGYSSLTYLKRLPVDVLKIDRSFVQGLPHDGNDAALTTAIIAMGRSLQLELIAEGVETWEQVEFLADRRCFLVQGFLFAKPLPPEPFAKLAQSGLFATLIANAENVDASI